MRPDTLVVSYSGVPGGAERLLLEWAPALPGRTTVACPRGRLAEAVGAAGLAARELTPRPLTVEPSLPGRVRAVARLAGFAGELRALMARERPRLVVAWGIPSLLGVAAALRSLPGAPPLFFQHNDLLPASPAAGLIRAVARRCAGVLALSHAIARDLDPERRLGARLHVVHPGVDLERLPPAPAASGPPRALFLGAIVGWKRPDLALEATALAARELPELHLVMAGEPLDAAGEALAARLRERARRPDLAGRVHFAGRVADPRPELAAAGCLLHCADREPYGLVVVEAMACARAVVAPHAGGPAEILDARCGRLFAPGDASGAAQALVAVLGDPAGAQAMGAAGRARAEERFTLERARAQFTAAVAASR